MNSLLRRVTSFSGREDLVKQYLISQLSSSVKEIQLEAAQMQVSTDITASFCTVLEAIFIHGLKDIFMKFHRQLVQTLINDQNSAIGDPYLYFHTVKLQIR